MRVVLALMAMLAAVAALLLPLVVSQDAVDAVRTTERHALAAWLGPDRAARVHARAARWGEDNAVLAAQLAGPAGMPADGLSRRLAGVAEALARTAYARRLDAVAALMLQRLATLAEWAVAGVPLLVAALLDAALMRDVALRARLHVSPALFGIGLHGMVILAAGLPVLALLPVVLPPLAWPLALAALGAAAHLAVGHFHRLR